MYKRDELRRKAQKYRTAESRYTLIFWVILGLSVASGQPVMMFAAIAISAAIAEKSNICAQKAAEIETNLRSDDDV